MDKLVAYAKCMRDHGISDFPDPTAGAGGGGGFEIHGPGNGGDLMRTNPRFQAADHACKSLLPAQRPPNPAQATAEVKLAACMRSHGFPSFPDPDGKGVFHLGGIDTESPQFQSAMNTCRSAAGVKGPIGVQAIGNS
jgi:hypothetical protein